MACDAQSTTKNIHKATVSDEKGSHQDERGYKEVQRDHRDTEKCTEKQNDHKEHDSGGKWGLATTRRRKDVLINCVILHVFQSSDHALK